MCVVYCVYVCFCVCVVCGCIILFLMRYAMRLSVTAQPAVSIGNIAQLSVDVLICTYHLSKIGYFHDPNVLPVVGVDALMTKTKKKKRRHKNKNKPDNSGSIVLNVEGSCLWCLCRDVDIQCAEVDIVQCITPETEN